MVVSDVHGAELHMLDPKIAVGLGSMLPKLFPSNVSRFPALAGALAKFKDDMTGASNEKLPFTVPTIALTVTVAGIESPEAELTTHRIVESLDQEVLAHTLLATAAVTDLSSETKFTPKIDRYEDAVAGKFWGET